VAGAPSVRASRALRAWVLVLVLGLAACGSGADEGGGNDGCVEAGDVLTADLPVVRARIRCSGEAFTASETGRSIPASTWVRVRSSGDTEGQASLRLGQRSMCAFGQNRVTKTAVLVTREPEGALFRQKQGVSRCTIGNRPVVICLDATVEVTGEVHPTQYRAICDPDPILNVGVLRGSMSVTLGSGEEFELEPGQELRALPEPRVVAADFTQAELDLFLLQAAELGYGPTPTPTPTPSPTPTLTPSPTPTPTPTPIEPPSNALPPTITWDEAHRVLIADPGSWSGAEPIDFQYGWESACHRDGTGCRQTGASGQTYVPTNADCQLVRVVVTATNAAGSTTAASQPFDIQCVD
jgi:hypothetical protein